MAQSKSADFFIHLGAMRVGNAVALERLWGSGAHFQPPQ